MYLHSRGGVRVQHGILPGDETAMTGLDGAPLTGEQVLQRVEADGAFVVFLGRVAVAERTECVAALRRTAGARGMRVSIREMGSVALISNSARREQMGQISEALLEEQALLEVVAEQSDDTDAIPSPMPDPGPDPGWNHPSRGARLRLVPDLP